MIGGFPGAVPSLTLGRPYCAGAVGALRDILLALLSVRRRDLHPGSDVRIIAPEHESYRYARENSRPSMPFGFAGSKPNRERIAAICASGGAPTSLRNLIISKNVVKRSMQ